MKKQSTTKKGKIRVEIRRRNRSVVAQYFI